MRKPDFLIFFGPFEALGRIPSCSLGENASRGCWRYSGGRPGSMFLTHVRSPKKLIFRYFVCSGRLTFKNSYFLAFPGPGNPSNRSGLKFPCFLSNRELLGWSGDPVMRCFLFAFLFAYSKPWEALWQHLHTCTMSAVQSRASGMVWR